MKRFVVILLLILIALSSWAKEVESPIIILPISQWGIEDGRVPLFPYSTRINTKVVGYLNNDDNWHDNFVITDINNKIWLEINPYDGVPIDFSFNVGITLKIKYYSFPDGQLTEEDHVLKVNYDPNSHTEFKKIDLLHLKGGQFLTASITSIEFPRVDPSKKANLYSKILLKAQTTDTRYYNKSIFQPFNCSNISLTDAGDTKVTLSWPPTLYAEEYDVEYTFDDTYSQDALSVSNVHHPFVDFNLSNANPSFFTNATRITVKGNNITLPLINEKALYKFRIRAVGRRGEGFKNRFEMPWSCVKEYITLAHTDDKLNYQTIATFAEEGKYKIVNEYFDGRMASRQKVTALQSNNYALVQESIYDGIGRKAIEVLPGAVMNGAVNFYAGFNRNLGGQPYGPNDFEQSDTCRRPPAPMSNRFGTSRYYSPEFYNSLNAIQKESELKLLPDAYGYPFTQTRFMNDNTNRPLAQGGVGRDHIIDGGHETKISYVNPTQSELDRLFGTEVGLAKHYKKIVTQDPNGQVSFAYQDLKGNTIATSLWGKAPNLDTLESYKRNLFTDDLTVFSMRDPDNTRIYTEHTFFVGEDNQGFDFNYQVITGAFRDATCNLSSICFDCIYDVQVFLVNTDCNDTLFKENKTIGSLSNINQVCEGANWESLLKSITLSSGTHSVKVNLTVNDEAANAYIDNFIKDPNNQCIEHISDFQETFFAQIPDTPCDFDCSVAESEIVRLEALIRKGKSILDGIITQAEHDRIKKQISGWEAQIKAWEDICGDFGGLNVCEMAENRMLKDMSPYGQYGAIYLDTMTNTYKANDSLSIYADANYLNNDGSTMNYKNPVFVYPFTNPDGTATNINPNSITLGEFITVYWQDEWADQYLKYHPEYCYLLSCNHESADFDKKLNSITTASQARSEGYVSATGQGNPPFILGDISSNSLDPQFKASGLLAANYDQMKAELNNFYIDIPSSYNLPSTSLYDMAKQSTCNAIEQIYIYAQNNPEIPVTNVITPIPNCLSTISFVHPNSQIADQLWNTWKGLYMSIKQKYEYKERSRRAIADGCYNGCIGSDPFPAGRDNFSASTVSQDCNRHYADLFKDKQRVFVSPYDVPGMEAIVDLFNPELMLENANLIGNSISEVINSSIGCGLDGEIPTFPINNNGSGCIPYDCMSYLPSFFNQLIDTVQTRILFMDKDLTSVDPPACFRTSPFLSYVWKNRDWKASTNTLTFTIGSAEADPNACSVSLQLIPVQGVNYPSADLNEVLNNIQSAGNFQPDYTMADANGETSYFTASAISGVQPNTTLAINIQGYISCAKFGRCCNDKTEEAITACLNIRNVDDPTTVNEELWIGDANPYFDPKWVENPCGDTSTIDIPEIVCTDTISLCCPDTIITIPIPVDSCQKTRMDLAMYNAALAYEQYITQKKRELKAAYMAQCLASVKQTFTMRYESGEHHFVLSYYDQSGNLTRTVPPNGTYDYYNTLPDRDKTFQTQAELDAVTAARAAGQRLAPVYEDWDTRYTYNSLNQITTQNLVDHGSATPANQAPPRDGVSKFYYDELGRLALSQNPQQALDKKYSYTNYDNIGRIVEAGQFFYNTGFNVLFNQSGIFLSDANSSYVKAYINPPSANMFTKEQITHTYYDEGRLAIDNRFPNRKQENLRNRVAYAAYYDTWAERNDRNPVSASYYSYDEIGNVKALLQTMKGAFSKRMEYAYDLVSGNVNEVRYQPDEEDQFIHRYQYDADNRITEVNTSTDGCIWDKEAKYFYYPHGPLARVELGDEEIQGLDYIYTIHGWTKGVNGIMLDKTIDPGKDGQLNTINSSFAPDQHSYMLNYFGATNTATSQYQGDYHSISGSQTFEPKYNGDAPSLYNGNIRNMSTSINQFLYRDNQSSYKYLSNDYRYDQLNRIKEMRPWDKYNRNSNTWAKHHNRTDSRWPTMPYYEKYSFDGNGNIDTLYRNGSPSRIEMDKMTYDYKQKNNRLTAVKDLVPPTNYPPQPGKMAIYDIDNQNDNNYQYDRLGNMVSDASEGLTMEWNVSGKVRRIKDSNGLPHDTPAKEINMVYDPLGNRVAKITNDKATYYVRDAQGNVMATYQRSKSASTTVPVQTGLGNTINLEQWKETPVTWESAYIYGSHRLGEYRANKILNQSKKGEVNDTSIKDIGLSQIDLINTANNPSPTTTPTDPISTMLQDLNWGSLSGSALQGIQDYMAELGNTFQQGKYKHSYSKTRHYLFRDQKLYELTNHLGNVLTNISDRKSLTDLTIGSFSNLVAEVASATDYYPGGMIMSDRHYTYSDTTYRYKHQGQESDDEIAGLGADYFYKYRMSDSRLVRFWSVDPLTAQYPYYSNYQYSGNKLINSIELEGLEEKESIYADFSFYWERGMHAAAFRSLEFKYPVKGEEGFDNIVKVIKGFEEIADFSQHPKAKYIITSLEDALITVVVHLGDDVLLKGNPISGIFNAIFGTTSQVGEYEFRVQYPHLYEQQMNLAKEYVKNQVNNHKEEAKSTTSRKEKRKTSAKKSQNLFVPTKEIEKLKSKNPVIPEIGYDSELKVNQKQFNNHRKSKYSFKENLSYFFFKTSKDIGNKFKKK